MRLDGDSGQGVDPGASRSGAEAVEPIRRAAKVRSRKVSPK